MTQTVEHERISGDGAEQWDRWGSYLSSRSWGTVRESGANDKAWELFPFEHSQSRTTRWSEDGIGGFSDQQQRICLASAFWNEQDPILKERYFGLSNNQGNHGEDVKEYFFYVDGLPSYSYMKMVYRYPQAEFPYRRLVQENALRGPDDMPFHLIDALPNSFAARRYFDIAIEFAKADADDLLYRITATNCGDRPAPLHVLPQLFFRRTWTLQADRPLLRGNSNGTVHVEHPDFDGYRWYVESASELLFTENATNCERLYDLPNESPYTKDGIDYAVVRGQRERVNPERVGTKCAAHHHAVLDPGESWVIRARLSPADNDAPFAGFDAIVASRHAEADEFYNELQNEAASEEDRQLQRAGFAGMSWNNNYYSFNVSQWIDELAAVNGGDEVMKAFSEWEHFDAHDIISVPDPWEYPWLASWDLSFQTVTIAMLDPERAKHQALLLLSDRYMKPNGAMAAFEGDLSTPHPPVTAWAVWHIYQEAKQDRAFLEAAFEPLKRHFAWWLDAHQTQDHLFDGGFVGKDNISIIDRNDGVPEGGWILQADSTGWMAFFALNMLAIAVELERDKEADYFLGHFAAIRDALQRLWDIEEQFLFDQVYLPDGECIPLKVRSMVGLIPLVAAMALEPRRLDSLPIVLARLTTLTATMPDLEPNANGDVLLAVLPQPQIKHLMNVLLDPDEFLSRFGLRSVSKYHAEHPAKLELGGQTHELTYTPGNSSDKMFGGNSNWRGPVWPPLNHVLIEALYTYADYFPEFDIQRGDERMPIKEAVRRLVESLTAIFKPDENGHRPYLGDNPLFQSDANWHDMFWFHEHFNPETGAGLGASHQNGWSAFFAGLIQYQSRGRLALKQT